MDIFGGGGWGMPPNNQFHSMCGLADTNSFWCDCLVLLDKICRSIIVHFWIVLSSSGDKLKILSTLVHQFLSYAASRDLVEDNFEKLRQLKMDLKQLQWSELRREREEATAR